MLTILTAAALALQPLPAGPDEGPEAVSAMYFGPPNSTEFEPLFDAERLNQSGPIELASQIGAVEEALTTCKKLRYQMDALIGDNYGSYSVHPAWIKGYQNCILTRTEEIKMLGRAIDSRKKDLLAGREADSAVRVADAMARLTLYQLDVKKAVEKEVRTQRSFVEYYNTGNKNDGTVAIDASMATPEPMSLDRSPPPAEPEINAPMSE